MFGPQCPTSPLLPPRKDPLEDFDGYRSSANTHPHKQHFYGLLDSTMHTSRNCVTNYIQKFNVIVLGWDLCCENGLIHSLHNLAQLTKCASESVCENYSLTADCDLRLALQLNFLQLHLLNSNHLLIVMTSSLLLIASSRMYADVSTAVSRFLSISNADINVAARSFLQYMC
ncbi:hypothetical protein F511_09798 [Dorcoceras hygrometricum]|uniref:Uncharacterized protein n=1 Tax=Dorcoceras hygrometricum TaxID=472368 RepID=A0A2Z7BWE8_9LAMI|nr:hypothetical protein F511_09798 [Dorcoceras hygrometricum]